MAEVLRVLGQNSLPANTLTDVYMVPACAAATISTFTICNRGNVAASFRVSIAIGGSADSLSQYIYYDQFIDANSTFAATMGITMSATDKIRAYASNSNLTINVFGIEVS